MNISIQRFKTLLAVFGVVLFVICIISETSWGIPSFARKYRTSCVTCHTAYPKLNGFGEAYRLNGYQIPSEDGDEEAYIKEEAVSLGAAAYKRVWPEAVWPGAIPGSVPLSIRAQSIFEYRPDAGSSTDFIFPSELQLLFGGTLGEDISFYGDIGLFENGEGEVDVGRLFVQFDSLFEEKLGRQSLNLKIGRIEPAAVPFSSHRRIGLSNYGINGFSLTRANFGLLGVSGVVDDHDDGEEAHAKISNPFTESDLNDDHDNPYAARQGYVSSLSSSSQFGGGGHHGSGLALGRSQSGIELNGILVDRFFYGVGLVNGNGSDSSNVGFDNNSEKDFYFRGSYKFGGMALTGAPSDEELSDGSGNWRDDSVRVGGFAYFGDADDTLISGFVPGTETLLNLELGNYQRYGADVSIYYKDLNLFGALMYGNDDIGLTGASNDGVAINDEHELSEFGIKDHEFYAWFVQADYVLYPWLQPFIRYDSIMRDDFDDVDRIVPGVVILPRANMRVILESQIYTDDSDDNVYQIALEYAF